MQAPPAECHPDLLHIATESMLEHGLAPCWPEPALAQLAHMAGVADDADAAIVDMTSLPWSSIEDERSRTVDRLCCCEPVAEGALLLRVALADVDALVRKGSALDVHARQNTSSVHAGGHDFTMLPEQRCAELASLVPGQVRLALVLEITVALDAGVTGMVVRRARVRNQAHLSSDVVATWLDGNTPPPAAAELSQVLSQLKLLAMLAQRLLVRRQIQGALACETSQPRAVYEGGQVVDMREPVQHRARQLVEELMTVASRCIAQFLSRQDVPVVRLVVRSPERWQLIVAQARLHSQWLPDKPDADALKRFLIQSRRADPLRYPELSQVICLLMGEGEYVVEMPGLAPDARLGYFAMAANGATHHTAPSRHYPDLVSQRQLKAVLAEAPAAYSLGELARLAGHCSRQQVAVRRVERKLRKCEAALWLRPRIGQRFEAIVSGHSGGNTWLRVFVPPVEGRLQGYVRAARHELAVGQRLRVKLVSASAEQGFIDFEPLS